MPGKQITAQQVESFMKARRDGRTQEAASAKAGVSERTGRRIEKGEAGRERSRRDWRTRPDPLEAVWQAELVPLLKDKPTLGAITLLEDLQRRHPGAYPDSMLRTLQRRVKRWRALAGPDQDVMFRQSYPPGHQAISDFTTLKRVTVTIGSEPLSHLLYHFRLVFSGFCYVMVVLGGESFTALAKGLQEALWRLGGNPLEHRTDSLSAAFKNLTRDERDDMTARYEALCAHYGMKPSRNNRGQSHENGAIESPHGHLKRRIEQALLLRGSSDFGDVASYQGFLDEVVSQINRRQRQAIAEERQALNPLPHYRSVDYSETVAVVTSSATIEVKRVLYTVPSRLKGERLRIHLYDDRLIGYLGSEPVVELERAYPQGKQRARRVNYRHVIGSLKKKPQAFRYSQLRDDLLPNDTWRRLWRLVDEHLAPKLACRWIVGALALAAKHDCEAQLAEYALLNAGDLPSLNALQRRFGRRSAKPPVITVHQHPLASYDQLLTEPVRQ